jgi:hypothetical protein
MVPFGATDGDRWLRFVKACNMIPVPSISVDPWLLSMALEPPIAVKLPEWLLS